MAGDNHTVVTDNRTVDIAAMSAFDMWANPYSLDIPIDLAGRIKACIASPEDIAVVEPVMLEARNRLIEAEVNVPRPS